MYCVCFVSVCFCFAVGLIVYLFGCLFVVVCSVVWCCICLFVALLVCLFGLLVFVLFIVRLGLPLCFACLLACLFGGFDWIIVCTGFEDVVCYIAFIVGLDWLIDLDVIVWYVCFGFACFGVD